MSGIFGILNLNGQAIETDSLQAMCERMAYSGPDGASIWHAEHVGLGCLLRHNTPEASYESLPRRDPASGVVLTAHARLDNRNTLISDFGFRISDCQEAEIPDSDLILQSYLRWGEECVKHLLGDWAFALWDPRERQLFLARDPDGISAIHYYRHPHFFAFASSLKGVFALRELSLRPNLLRVAQVLTSWQGDGVQTAYADIFRLPAAHTLTITGDKMEIRRYWNPENIVQLHLASDAEYVEAFLEIYREAVHCRLRSPRPIGGTLSGGLDSGSVCALAARELRARGERLSVFTSVPMYSTERATIPQRFGDESAFVEADHQFIDNLDVNYLRAENVSPLAGIQHTLDVHDEPGHAAGNMFWIIALMQAAQQQGLGTLLTGQMGNATISWTGGVENLLPLILTGHWRTFWSQARKVEPSMWKTIKRYLLRPVVRPVRGRIQRARFVGREIWEEYSAINKEFARSLQLTRQMAANGHDPAFVAPTDPIKARLQIIQSGANIVGTIWAEKGASFDLEVRDPTMDKRVMEFCLAIPDEQYRMNGQDRALIRRAMVGLLPDSVRLNTRRGLQAADLGYRILATLPEVQSMMIRLEQSALAREVLDLPKMNRVLQALQKQVNATTTAQCGTILMRGMMTGMFLLRF